MYIDEVKNNAFYQFPQWLLKEEPYKDLGDKAKLMYMLLFDRRTLSIKNKWYDDDGQIYMYFTNEQFMKELNCANGSVVKAKKELAQVGLLKETRQGMNKPNRLYITGYSKTKFQGVQKLDVGHSKTEFQDVQKLDGINTNNINTNISILSNQQQEEVDEIRKSYDMFFEAFPKQRKTHLFNKTSLQILMNLETSFINTL